MNIYKGVSELTEQFVNLFWGIGYFGWQISTIYALYVSFSQSTSYGLIFAITFVISGWLNKEVFKNFIHDPRPANSIPFLTSEHFDKKSNGMPSGHAQQTAFSLTIAYLLTEKYFNESLLLFGITVLQRYIYHNHTLPQLIIGSILGFCLGCIIFYLFTPMKNSNRMRFNFSSKLPVTDLNETSRSGVMDSNL